MTIRKTRLDGLVIIEPKVFRDERGFFTESYSRRTFEKLGLNFDIVQDNHSLSIQKGTIRGLHYQLDPKAQTKIVKVIKGEIMDVAVDIRKGSPTYSQWESVILTAENMLQLIVPKGFAHGFCTLTPDCEVFYKVDEFYSPEHDRAIIWNDPDLAIKWPNSNPILSEKDSKAPLFKDAEINFTYGNTK